MIRFALPLIPSRAWQGGYNYVRNVVDAVRLHGGSAVQPVVVRYTDSTDEDVRGMSAAQAEFLDLGRSFREGRLLRIASLLTVRGCDLLVAGAMQREGVDVVWEVADYFGARFPLPVLAWFPDLQHRCLPHYFGITQYWQRELGFRRQVATGRTILLSSQAAASDFQKFYPQAAGRTQVVRFAVPFGEIPNSDAIHDVKERYGLGPTYFFMPNQYWVHKNHLAAIRAVAQLKGEGESIQLVSCGNPGDPKAPGHYDLLRKEIESRQIAENFLLLGRIPTPDVHCLLAGCRALVNPSQFEGWSTTVEEAKTYGVPMVLSDLAVHHEQAPAETLFFAPDDHSALAGLLKELANHLPTERTRPEIQRLRIAAEQRQQSFVADLARAVEFAQGAFQK